MLFKKIGCLFNKFFPKKTWKAVLRGKVVNQIINIEEAIDKTSFYVAARTRLGATRKVLRDARYYSAAYLGAVKYRSFSIKIASVLCDEKDCAYPLDVEKTIIFWKPSINVLIVCPRCRRLHHLDGSPAFSNQGKKSFVDGNKKPVYRD